VVVGAGAIQVSESKRLVLRGHVARRDQIRESGLPSERTASTRPLDAQQVLTHDQGRDHVLGCRPVATRRDLLVLPTIVECHATESETAGSPAKTHAMRCFWASCRSICVVVGPRGSCFRGAGRQVASPCDPKGPSVDFPNPFPPAWLLRS
jgi:hypothetical protein